VPDHRRRTEADAQAGVLEAPAEVDVVAGGAEERIEAVDARQRLAPERHVAAGNVLGGLVVEQDVRRPARRGGDARRRPLLLSGRKVRPADGRDAGLVKPRRDEQPVGIDDAVGVKGYARSPVAAAVPVLRGAQAAFSCDRRG
jgi:hypothetical protein